MKFSKRQSRMAGEPAADSPEMQAARWIARRELGLCQKEDEAVFERWRADPQNEAALSAAQAALEEVQGMASSEGIVKMRAEALAQTPRGPLLLGNVPAGIAATVLIGVFAISLAWREAGRRGVEPAQTGQTVPVPGTSVSPAAAFYQTQKGERRTFTLSDGSRLTLNTASRVEVAMTAEKRSIHMVSGQALFDVAKDRNRPFVVAAGPMEVTAIGTRFDVRIERERTRVVLVDGRVKVEPLARQGIARLLPALDRHYLQPGEQLIAKGADTMSVATADVEQSTSWQYGRLVFRGETLGAAVAEFNRYSERQLSIADPALAQLPISGVFSVSRPENFLAAVKEFYPVRIDELSPGLTALELRVK